MRIFSTLTRGSRIRTVWSELTTNQKLRAALGLIAIVAIIAVTASVAMADPGGGATGTIADIPAAIAGKPTLDEIAATVGHNKIADQLHVDPDHRLPRHVHAGGIRLRRDRLHSREERRRHHDDELRGLRHRHDGVLDLRLRATDGRRRRRRGTRRNAGARLTSSRSISSANRSACSECKGFFLSGDTYDVGVFALFLFQMVFMDTAATIPTGAMAERWKFSASASSASSCRCSSIRCSRTGCGAAAGWRLWARTSASGTDTSTSRAAPVVHAVGGVAAAGGRRRARASDRQVSRRTASPSRSLDTTFRWLFSERSSWRSAGSGSTRAARSPAPICASPSLR